MSTIEVVTCSGCGGPLPEVPTLSKPVKCEYCEITNVFQPPRVDSSTGELIISEEELAERDYQIYQQQEAILSHYSGELVGEEISKIRISLPIGARTFQVLVVLDNYPHEIFVDVSPDPTPLIGPFIELDTIKNWEPGKSSALDVIQELEQRLRTALGVVESHVSPELDRKSTQPRKKKEKTHEEKDPVFLEIMQKFEAVPEKKGLKVIFYSPSGEEKILIVKRKKKYPIELKSKFSPLVEGILDDYQKGRISLIQALTDIERVFYV